METVTLGLEGEHIPLAQFAAAVEQFSLLIGELSHEAHADEVRWEIVDLAAGSATTTIGAVSDNGAGESAKAVVKAYLGVGRGLQEGSAVQFSPKVKAPAEGLAHILNGDVEGLRFETAETELFVTEAPEKPPKQARYTSAHGAVTGRVQTLSSRAGLRFTLYDRLHDRAVACYLDEGQEEMIRGAWDRWATVEGWVTRNAQHGWPVSVRKITAIHSLDSGGGVEPDRHAYRRARGARPRTQDDLTPEERLRKLRDAG